VPGLRRPRLTIVAIAFVVLAVAVQLDAQFGRGFSSVRLATDEDYDGKFQFCRIMFSGSWDVDQPRAEINLSIRLSELTKTTVGRVPNGDPNHVTIRLTDPTIFNCPFIMMTEVGTLYITPAEAANLRDYLLKGGFLWADDFWGTREWFRWFEEFQQVLPSDEYPMVDLDPTHPLFRSQFFVTETPQIPSINSWARSGGATSENGPDSAEVHTRAILDRHGNIMVLITHNTDFGDSFEREADDPTYFLNFSVPGYAFGINALLYAMTH
jgi:hypothetical protein